MKRLALFVLALLIGRSALADGNGPAVDLTALLPPPPAAGSPTARQDMAGVLAVQARRTPMEIAAAEADQAHSVFRFADVFGAAFTPDRLPHTAAFFARVAAYDKGEVKAAKLFWQHPRPVQASHRVHPLSVEKPNDWSYPSGHSTLGYTEAVLLANMVPERRAAIFARADLYAHHRIVMGVHYPSDVEAGRLAGTVLGSRLLDDPAWQAAYAAARAELRKALALPGEPAASTVAAR
ncbi:phosphatase PAP2 family protein [Rhodanobacter sp. Si-c]|uniref:Acid phosphatase n=1 Tax=Rhodanobacter lycopersici TaxID=3162487 RepID=A0ABV3QHW3_9GAMM